MMKRGLLRNSTRASVISTSVDERKHKKEIAKLQQELIAKHLELESEKQKHEKTKAVLGGALTVLRGSIRLLEAWAYGPAFKRGGVQWPNGTCNAPDYVKARRWLKLYDEEYD